MSSFAEEESRSISENVTWAVRHRYAQGIYYLPGQLLGYTHDRSGKVTVDDAAARVVRFIYLLALSGKSSTDICRFLMKYGIPTPGLRQRWEPATVRSILKKLRTTDFIRCTLQQPSRPLATRAFAVRGCIFAL